MKIQLLGTAAAATWPSIYSDSEYNRKIRALGGKNIRSRSQAIIDDKHVIDWPSDSFYHSIKFDIDFSQIMDIFITHSHPDHWVPEEMEYIAQGCFAYNTKHSPLSIYGDKKVISDALKPILGETNLFPMLPYKSVVTKDGYKWTAIHAAHKPNEVALNYIIEHQGKTVLYRVDSGPYTDEVLWNFLKKFKFDCVITECTFNFHSEPHEDHETYETVLQFRDRLMSQGSMTEDTQMWLTHIHYIKDGLTHEEAEEICKKDNIHLGYDGVVILV